MEFGLVDPKELGFINFVLPPDQPETTALLEKIKTKKKEQKVYVGCAKWGRKDWVGKIYPKKTKEADFLHEYSKHFDCVELNATFYKMPTLRQTLEWSSKVSKDFKFCPKFTDEITHIKRLKDVTGLTEKFLEGIHGFGKNLGPVFFIPHPSMGPKSFDTIETFIKTLPKDLQVFVEFRNSDWFKNSKVFKDIFSMLEENNTGSIITDASGRRDCVHMRLTTPQAFIRFVGNGLHPTDYTRIDDWVMRIKKWMEEGIETVYFFMHQHEELHSPELSSYLIQQLNERCDLAIRGPKFTEQKTLFD